MHLSDFSPAQQIIQEDLGVFLQKRKKSLGLIENQMSSDSRIATIEEEDNNILDSFNDVKYMKSIYMNNFNLS